MKEAVGSTRNHPVHFFLLFALSRWNGHISAANRGGVSVSVRVKAVWRALPQGTSVFAALPSSLCDFDNDIDLDCRWGAVLHQSKSIKQFKP